jgi:hypothetical protein
MTTSKSSSSTGSASKPAAKSASRPAAKSASKPDTSRKPSDEKPGNIEDENPAAKSDASTFLPGQNTNKTERDHSDPLPYEDVSDRPLEGHFVDVVAGEHKGLWGLFQSILKRDKDGEPSEILVRNRDHAGDKDLVTVAHKDARRSKRAGGR